jgi:hypothetical protein
LAEAGVRIETTLRVPCVHCCASLCSMQARGVAFAAVFLAFLAKLRFYTLTEATRRTPTGPKASSRWRNVARVFKQLTLTLLTIAPLLELAVEAHATTPGPAFHVVRTSAGTELLTVYLDPSASIGCTLCFMSCSLSSRAAKHLCVCSPCRRCRSLYTSI